MEPWQFYDREARREAFENRREARGRFGEPITRTKAMTHFELLQACRTVRDNLGRKGTVSVEATVTEDYRDWEGRYVNGFRLEWTIAFHDSQLGNGHVQVSSVESQQFALDSWTEAMRERFSGKAIVSGPDVAETLDISRLTDAAAST